MKIKSASALIGLVGVLTVILSTLGALPAQAATGRLPRPADRGASASRGSVAAASDSWTGNGDGTSWGDASNWSAGVPENGDSVVIAPTSTEPEPDVTGMPSGTQLQDLTLTDSSLSGADVTVAGSFSWTVGTGEDQFLDASLTAQESASISGAGEKTVQAPMAFAGATDISGSGLILIEDSGSAITNSGTFTMEPGSMIEAQACCVAPDEFLNTGTVTMPASSGTATLSAMNFDDQGPVSVGTGSLLDVTVGPVELTSGMGVSGGGTLAFDQDAQVTLADNVSIGSGTTVALTGGAQFTGTGSFTGTGKFSWTGGTVDGNLTVGSSISTTISGSSEKDLSAPGSTPTLLAFQGSTTLKGSGPLDVTAGNMSSSGTFTIEPGSTLQAEACCVAPDEFLNTGTLTVPASKSGTATLGWMNFDDQGSVSVGKGSLLHVTVGPAEFASGAGVSGGGTLEFDQNAQAALADNVSIGSGTTVALTGGAQFTGTGSFTGTGNFSWAGGTVDGNLTVGKSISSTIGGPNPNDLTSPGSTPTQLAFQGPTTLTGSGTIEMSGATSLKNQGAFTLQSGTTIEAEACCVSPDQFINSGTLTVAAGTGSATISLLSFTNHDKVQITGGTLAVQTLGYRQSAGSTDLAGGSLSSSKPIEITGGTLAGYGAIHGSVVNQGTVNPSTTGGVLTISGSYRQASTGALTSAVTGTSPGTTFGQLGVGGKATLAGTLNVSTANGFTPTAGESFVILKYGSHTGTFSTLSGSPSYTVTYQPADAEVIYPT